MTISFQPRFAGYLNQSGQRKDTASTAETYGPIIGPLSQLQRRDRGHSVAQRIHHAKIRRNLPVNLVNEYENRWRTQLVTVLQPVADFLYKHIAHCPPEVAAILPKNPKNLSLHFAKMITQYLPPELQHQLQQIAQTEQLAAAKQAHKRALET